MRKDNEESFHYLFFMLYSTWIFAFFQMNYRIYQRRKVRVNRKPYVRYTILGISLLLSLLCVIRIAMPNREWNYAGSYEFVKGTPCPDQEVYEHISLGAGVYRLELSYESAGDTNAMCNVKDGTVYYGGLLCNGEHMYAALDHTSYDFWLFEPTEELSVTIDYSGQESLTTGNLRIVETNLLWTRYLTILLAISALILWTLWYQKRDAQKEKKERRHVVIFGIGVIAFLASIPYLYDGMISGADLTYHLQRIEGVKDGLLTGQFPVRLEPRWVFDHGYANGIFYCNLLLYFPAALRMLGFTVTESYLLYCIALNIATAAIAWYCFGKMFRDDVVGLACSGLYTLSIFRVYRLLGTGAVGEGSAFTFFPLVLYGIYLVFEGKKEEREFRNSWIVLGLGYAGLVQTHVLSCEIAALMTVLLCLVYLPKLFEKERFLKCVQGAFFALGLSLWYLVPFLDYYFTQDVKIRHASARTIQERGVTFVQELQTFWNFHDTAASTTERMQYTHPVGPGLFLIAGVFLLLLLLFLEVIPRGKETEKSFAIRSAGLGCLVLWMATDTFPWDALQTTSQTAATLVSSLQFPYRFIGWGMTFLIVVVGYLLSFFRKNQKLFYRMGLVIVMTAVATSYVYLIDAEDESTGAIHLYNRESMGFGYISGEEYLIYGTDSSALSFAKPKADEGIGISEYEKKGLRATFFCENSSDTQGTVKLPILLYKGYQASGDGGESLEITDDRSHLLGVSIPAGYSDRITVKFTEPWYWRAAELITLTVVVAFVAGMVYKRRCR